MKLIEVPLGGRTYYARFSLRVLAEFEEKSLERGGNGNAQEEISLLLSNGKPSDLLWVISRLIEAGRRAAELDGIDPVPPPLSYDDLLDLAGLEDLTFLYSLASGTMTRDTKTTVETAPAKNAEATPDL